MNETTSVLGMSYGRLCMRGVKLLGLLPVLVRSRDSVLQRQKRDSYGYSVSSQLTDLSSVPDL
jgi:hypothetical protein